MIEQYLTPGLVIAVGIFLWREIRHLSDRIDRHLEGHA